MDKKVMTPEEVQMLKDEIMTKVDEVLSGEPGTKEGTISAIAEAIATMKPEKKLGGMMEEGMPEMPEEMPEE